ncbi:MAG: hypothetical protein R3C11_02935 [Planctomycetaceae bacterium]
MYIKRGTKVLGPYTWIELKEMEERKRLYPTEWMSNSKKGPFKQRDVRQLLEKKFPEDEAANHAVTFPSVRQAGSLFLIVWFVFVISCSVLSYLSQRSPGDNLDAAGRGMSDFITFYFGVVSLSAIPALPGAICFSLGKYYRVAFSGVILFALPLLLLLPVSLMGPISIIELLLIIMVVWLIMYLRKNRASFS